jgi:nitrogen fixation protein FixH
MSAKTTLFAVLGFFAAVIAICVTSYISAYNSGNMLENKLKASYENNQNILAQYSNTIAEAAQIPAMQRDDMKDVITAALDGRYGDEGSKAMFQAITEDNPNIDSAVYTKLQQIIQAGRKDFENGQKSLITVKQTYETALGSLWKGMWMRIAGYPKVNLADYKIVTNARTDAAFETKSEEPILLR